MKITIEFPDEEWPAIEENLKNRYQSPKTKEKLIKMAVIEASTRELIKR